MLNSSAQVTKLLQEWSSGNEAALAQLMPMVYGELHRIAKRYMKRQNRSHTLQTDALVHEAYFRLVGSSDKKWEGSTHFFGVAAQAMRHVLVDYARASHSAKRGGEQPTIQLDEAIAISRERLSELIALDDALASLAALNLRQSQVVELRYFGGFSVEETAATLNVSRDTVMRDWRAGKAWLYRELSRSPDECAHEA